LSPFCYYFADIRGDIGSSVSPLLSYQKILPLEVFDRLLFFLIWQVMTGFQFLPDRPLESCSPPSCFFLTKVCPALRSHIQKKLSSGDCIYLFSRRVHTCDGVLSTNPLFYAHFPHPLICVRMFRGRVFGSCKVGRSFVGRPLSFEQAPPDLHSPFQQVFFFRHGSVLTYSCLCCLPLRGLFNFFGAVRL